MPTSTSGSRISGFYSLPLEQRLSELAKRGELSAQETAALSGQAGLTPEQADHMIENVVGTYALPLGIALNLLVNGRDVFVPMAIEEPSVVAGASFMAKLARAGGGFLATTTPPEMIGQMQLLGVPDVDAARASLLGHKNELLAAVNEVD